MANSVIVSGPDWTQWLDSMEGIPDRPPPAPVPAPRPLPTGWQQKANRLFEQLGGFLPGLALAAILAFAGERLTQWVGTRVLGFESNPLSAVAFAVVLGLLVRNTLGLPAIYEPGLRVCLRFLLRFGIALLGLRLSLDVVGKVGVVALPVVLICIGVALIVVTWINQLLGLPRRLGILIAAGTSICGVSAIVATGAAVNAEEDEVSYAVACVTLFGMLALFCYPFLAFALFAGDAKLVGVFLGTAVHDTAQVAGAGLIYQQQFDAKEALNTATVTKLMRNACMIGVIPLLVLLYHRSVVRHPGDRPGWRQALPMFVLAFLALAVVRTLGDLGDRAFFVLDKETWKQVLAAADQLAAWCLAVAMVSVGLGTGLAKLRILGLKPFTVGFAGALLVGAVSWALLSLASMFGWM